MIAGLARMEQKAFSNFCCAVRRFIMHAEIAWDLVMSEDMPFAEGCYRLNGGDWKIFTATKARPNCPAGVRIDVKWASGVTGMNIVLLEVAQINRASLMRVMSEVLNVEDWREVDGPD
ncbi:MAG: hypothetical protein EOO38_18230, partial [Cytophagaceae bacterium]